MAAVKLPSGLIIRTGARWDQDFLFRLADKVTPQAGRLDGRAARLVFVPTSQLARADGSFIVDGPAVEVDAADVAVRVRLAGADTSDYAPAAYGVSLELLDVDDVEVVAVGEVRIEQGLALIADGETSEASCLGLAGDTVGTIVLTPLPSATGTGAGPQGRTGAKGDRGGLMPWVIVAANRLAQDTERLTADTSAGGFTITLPADGGEVGIRGRGDSLSVHALTIAGNGRTIDGQPTLTADADSSGFIIVFTAGDGVWTYTLTYQYGEG